MRETAGNQGVWFVSFAEATEVFVDRSRPGRYRSTIADNWDVVGNTNGGYLMALAARASSVAAGDRSPLSVTAHFLSPGRPGPVVIDTAVQKEGKRLTTVGATLAAVDEEGSERPLITMLGSYTGGTIDDEPIERVEATPPEMPDPDDCVAVAPGEVFPPNMMGRIDLRLHPDDAGFGAGRPVMRGWFRLLDDEPIDPFSLILATDAFPPTIFNAQLPVGWAPTVELTAHVRGRPVPGWLRCQYTTRFISGGLLEEDGEVWDGAGRLVAQSRQLALLPRSG